MLVGLSLDALKRLLVVGIDVENLNALWLVGVVAFVPNTPMEVQEDVPNAEEPVALCEGPLSVDDAAVPKIELVLVEDEGCTAGPKIEPVVVEDEGCTAAVEDPVAVFPGLWVSKGEGFVRNSPPVVAEGKDSAADALAMAFSTYIAGCIKGFTAQVWVLNSSSRFLLLVSGSR